MSKESAVAFLERLKGDEVLAERLRGCTVPEGEKAREGLCWGTISPKRRCNR